MPARKAVPISVNQWLEDHRHLRRFAEMLREPELFNVGTADSLIMVNAKAAAYQFANPVVEAPEEDVAPVMVPLLSADCPICDRPKRYCYPKEKLKKDCPWCCMCPKPETGAGEMLEPWELRPDRSQWGDEARLPISTPQKPGGCGCPRCHRWAETEPVRYALWRKFQAHAAGIGGRRWWTTGWDWGPAWSEFVKQETEPEDE